MAVSDTQYNALLGRLNRVETTMSDLLTALNQCVSVQQVHQLLQLTETRLQDVESRTTGLENRMTLFENSPT